MRLKKIKLYKFQMVYTKLITDVLDYKNEVNNIFTGYSVYISAFCKLKRILTEYKYEGDQKSYEIRDSQQ